MKKYAVTWSKTYYAHGEEVIEANSRVEAEEVVEENIGDYEGSIQWYPDENIIEAFELKYYGTQNQDTEKDVKWDIK